MRRGPQRVAGKEPSTHQRSAERTDLGQQRHDLRQCPDQMRCGAGHQDAALDRALVRDADLAAGEVAQAAVHQLRAPPAGAEGEVARLQQGDRQAAASRVEGHPGTGHPAADDQQVDLAAACQVGRLGGPALRVQGCVHCSPLHPLTRTAGPAMLTRCRLAAFIGAPGVEERS